MKFFYKINSLISNTILLALSYVVKSKPMVRNAVPYISQFANPAWAEMVLRDHQPITRDIMWPESGAETLEEYEQWVLSTCGMACTAMALQFFFREPQETITLAKEAATYGVYTVTDKEISAMQYLPYVQWAKTKRMKARVYTKLTYRSMKQLLSSGALIIASVTPNIRGFNTVPATQVGGHLILITGYNAKDKTLTFHNPSGFENDQTQVNVTMQVREFVIYFAGRGIAVSPVRPR